MARSSYRNGLNRRFFRESRIMNFNASGDISSQERNTCRFWWIPSFGNFEQNLKNHFRSERLLWTIKFRVSAKRMQLQKLQKPDQGRSLFLHRAALAQHTKQCSCESFCNITVLWVVNTDCMVKITISVSLCATASAVFVTTMNGSQKVETLISTNKWNSLVSDLNVF